MPDITKCTGHECTIRNTCKRYMAPSGTMQSIADFRQVDGKCEMYWEIPAKEKR